MNCTNTLTAVRVVVALGLLAAGDILTSQAGEVTVTLNRNVRYQTIRGWSCNPHYLGGSKEQREQVIAEAVDSLGITRVRWQQPNGNRSRMTRWELENDNGDPNDTDLSRFNTAYADEFVKAYVLPFKRRVEANGDPFELWLSPSFFKGGSTGDVPAFLLHSPGEYAEYATSFICYLRDKYGITTHHYAICNEAGNNNVFSPAVVAEFTKVLGERLQMLGLPAKGQFSDGVNAQVTWRYIQQANDDPDVWKVVDVLSYHWYGGKNHEFMPKIRDFAIQHGMATAQSEFMHLNIDHLYDDLTLGGVSYWSIYGLGGPGPGGQNFWLRPDDTSFRRGKQFWNFRQVMHYVRPGAVRIDCASDDAAVRALAFDRDGRTTVVLINTTAPHQARPVTITDLPAGRYGVCQCVNAKPYEELGVTTVGADRKLVVSVAANAVLTVYPHPGRNVAPTVIHWETTPTFLKAPASKVALRASAQDPERDQISYSWSVADQPPGTNAALTDPEAAATDVTGLTAPGSYAFTVAVSDGASVVRRDALLNVFEGNQPPRLIDAHNRIPVLVTLPHDNTHLRGGGFDLEGDKLSFAWSVVQQPVGSAVKIVTDDKGQRKLTNITKAGKHVLRLEGSDGTHTVAEELTIPVFPVNRAPVIERIGADPAMATLPDSDVALSATTSDPDGDTVSHWWRVGQKPPGARVAFAKQGGRETGVTGLTVPGVYVFGLTVVDRTKVARRAVTVTVRPEGAPAPPTGAQSDPPDARSKGGDVIARGIVSGGVTGKGQAWIEVRSTGGKTTRYIPRWLGGMPREGGGPEKGIVRAIAGLKTGDRVTIHWYVDNHVRIEAIFPEP